METFESLIRRQRDYFSSGRTRPVSFRLEQLKKLQEALVKRLSDIEAALEADLKRHHFETFISENLLLMSTLKQAIKKTGRWAGPKRVWPSILNFYSRDIIAPEPFGLALIISPWNYPILLSLAPLVGAISAGNCAVLKPSELSPSSSALISEIISSIYHPDYVAVVQGGAGAAQSLLENKFDKIFFTGSARVGRLVQKAAAERLTPVTLELGGKNPALVTESADLPVAAKRIIWGKLFNAGQTCLAPDYLLVHSSKKDELIKLLIETIISFYGRDIGQNPDYPRIIDAGNHARLSSCLEPAKIVWGGEMSLEDLYFGPTIMSGLSWDDPVMADEIFGPILPVLAYDSINEAVSQINGQEKPLALYLFTGDRRQIKTVWSQCSFGGGCVNDTMSHIINGRLPFGGIGQSGQGAYRGQWSFEAFSHYKSLVHRAIRPDLTLRYPPYASKNKIKAILTYLYKR